MTPRWGTRRNWCCGGRVHPNLLEVKIFPGTHFYMREQEADFLHYIQQIIEGEKAV